MAPKNTRAQMSPPAYHQCEPSQSSASVGSRACAAEEDSEQDVVRDREQPPLHQHEALARAAPGRQYQASPGSRVPRRA